MYKLKTPDIHASEIAGFLNHVLMGKDCIIKIPSSIKNFQDNSFFYLMDTDKFPKERIKNYKNILVLTSQNLDISIENFSSIKTNSPKLDFIRVVNEFFIEYEVTQIASTAKVHKNARIGRNVSIGENTIIGPEVTIGTNTKILNNVVITSRVEIGKNCIIKDNSTIGSEGYDFEIDEKGNPIHFPHIGKILIGNNVWIGAHSSIESAKIENTIINDNVKIDDLVQIGYNSEIGCCCMITAGVIVNRDVKIGENTLIAPNASIRDNIEIGKNVTVGQGSVVIKNIEDNAVYVGNPAYLLKKKELEEKS